MIQELLARAAEDLTAALNNFESARKELTDDELAAFKEVCSNAKTAVQEALKAAKGDLDAKTAETIRQIETLLVQGLQAIENKVTKAKQDVDTKVQQADSDITDKVTKAKQDVDTKVQQGLISINDKIQQVGADIDAKIRQGDTDTLKSAKSYTDGLLIKIFQNGYIQWPGMPSPLEDTSLHFEGYSWHEVNYRGNFFRAKGENAKAFSAKRLTKEQIKNGDYIFQDDEQQDAIRNITGETAANREGHLRINGSNFEMAGAFYGEQGQGTVHGSGQYTSAYVNLKFDASRAVPTAEENRPRNLTFVIWILVKDE